MAQTRAGAKALRMPLGFVVHLAGYEATPAEEMETEPHRQRTVESTPEPARLASEKERRILWARARKKGDELGIVDNEVAEALKRVCADLGFASRKQITSVAIDSILRAIDGWTLATFGEPEPMDHVGDPEPMNSVGDREF